MTPRSGGSTPDDAAVVRTPDGSLVVEVRLAAWSQSGLQRVIENARAAGADAIWAYGFAVDATLGFVRCGGYARLQAVGPAQPNLLPEPPLSLVRELKLECYRGVWGHHEPDEPDPLATHVALFEDDRWVGVCEFDADSGWIDSPGVIRGFRTPDRYARLVRGAAAEIGRRPLTLETWGDDDETLSAYEAIGFRLLEKVPGWELRLRRR
jgi:hypothetical protein